MEPSTKKDLKISFFVGIAAGILLLPTLNNLGVKLNLSIAVLAVIVLTLFTPLGYLAAYWLSRWFSWIIQFVKFGISGGLSAMADFGVLNLLIYLSGISSGIWYSVFKAISFLFGVTNSYLFNKNWTFKTDKEGQNSSEAVKFFLLSVISFIINVGIASFIVNVIGTPAGIKPELWANIGAASAAIIVLFWNFIWMKFIVFKR